jgi:site-specific recombinase XerD
VLATALGAGAAAVFLTTSSTSAQPSSRCPTPSLDVAGLRPLRFHDLRHSFGSLVIREFDPVAVKDFMGHAKITTTERYLHARSRRPDAARMTKAFAGEEPAVLEAAA